MEAHPELSRTRAIVARPTPVMSAPPVIRYRRNGLSVAEVYFEDQAPEQPPADLVRTLAVLEPRSDRHWKRRHTLTIDLTAPEDAIFGRMGKSTRYKVRRAMDRDRLRTEVFDSPTSDVLRDFADYYDEFARSKSLRPIFRPRLEAMAREGMLVLSRVAREGEPPVAWHGYAASGEHVLLMYSASLFRDFDASADRNMIGRANRCLHWHDIRWSKDAGYSAYDLGGFDANEQDPATRRINEFKQGFGGEVRPTHTCTSARSALGRLAKVLLRTGRVDF